MSCRMLQVFLVCLGVPEHFAPWKAPFAIHRRCRLPGHLEQSTRGSHSCWKHQSQNGEVKVGQQRA